MTAGGGGPFAGAGAGRLAASVRMSIGENCVSHATAMMHAKP
jgi:hypothetical protein